MPETATVVSFPVTVALECPECGATGQGSCHCGVPYVPARDAAAKAIAENPDLSDRAIAEKTGISHATVSRHRASTVSPETVEPRIGRDGKRRKMPAKRQPSQLRDEDADDWSGCNAPEFPEPPDPDPDPIKVAIFHCRYCCSKAVDMAQIASKVLIDADVPVTKQILDDIDDVRRVWGEFEASVTGNDAGTDNEKTIGVRIATTKPTTRKVTPPQIGRAHV